MHDEYRIVNAILLKTVEKYGVKYEEGTAAKVFINGDGSAYVHTHPAIKLKPDEFRIHIKEQDYMKLLYSV